MLQQTGADCRLSALYTAGCICTVFRYLQDRMNHKIGDIYHILFQSQSAIWTISPCRCHLVLDGEAVQSFSVPRVHRAGIPCGSFQLQHGEGDSKGDLLDNCSPECPKCPIIVSLWFCPRNRKYVVWDIFCFIFEHLDL